MSRLAVDTNAPNRRTINRAALTLVLDIAARILSTGELGLERERPRLSSGCTYVSHTSASG